MRSRVLAVVGIGAAVLIALSACESVTSGTITEMEHEEAEWDTENVCRTITTPVTRNGRTTTTSRTECTPQQVYDPESWCVTFEDAEGREGFDCISEERYNSLEIGDFYDANADN